MRALPATCMALTAVLLMHSSQGRADQSLAAVRESILRRLQRRAGAKARALLGELENFRAAFLQVGSIKTPADAPKAIVLITATKKAFQSVVRNPLVAGFATSDGQTPVMVMSAQGDTEFAQEIIRHEYSHTLLRYNGYDYPTWYNEGFASCRGHGTGR